MCLSLHSNILTRCGFIFIPNSKSETFTRFISHSSISMRMASCGVAGLHSASCQIDQAVLIEVNTYSVVNSWFWNNLWLSLVFQLLFHWFFPFTPSIFHIFFLLLLSKDTKKINEDHNGCCYAIIENLFFVSEENTIRNENINVPKVCEWLAPPISQFQWNEIRLQNSEIYFLLDHISQITDGISMQSHHILSSPFSQVESSFEIEIVKAHNLCDLFHPIT